MIKLNWETVTSEERFTQIVANWGPGPIAADVETAGSVEDGHLLGVSLAPLNRTNQMEAIYLPLHQYDKDKKLFYAFYSTPPQWLTGWLSVQSLVGHNFTYDKSWLDKTFEINTQWKADTRIMWHLASAPEGPRPYGLKDAQKELLGWTAKGDVALSDNVKKYGGSLKKGEHYLADIEVLAEYACLDVYSTIQIYRQLSTFFNAHNYWHMLCNMMEYSILLEYNTRQGIAVDKPTLEKAHSRLLTVKEAAEKRFRKELKHEIAQLEESWVDRRIALYKREYNKARYVSHPEEWKRFNLNSDKDKRELFFDLLKLPSHGRTKSGKHSVDGDSLKRINVPCMEAYLKYEHSNTISTSFSGSYLGLLGHDSRLHPGFNICGTVSYRLSGFKPYLLNAPFEEKGIMRCLRVEEGSSGVHADLSAIEPTITAHYSEDPALLKVFRDGLGDIYLDLALELFPNDEELHNGYDPNIPITKAVKQRFEKQRRVAKVIQLAVQYTGTGHTVAKNLTKEGIPTEVWEADRYVNAYWRKFRKVAELNQKLKALNRRDGLLRNVIGRIIRVPYPDYKDLPNRFIQSSAHDVLVLWVLEIYRLCKVEGIEIKPVLLDCHDSTSNQVPMAYVESLKTIYRDALTTINEQLGLCVTIKAETKTFQTLAGLKGDE